MTDQPSADEPSQFARGGRISGPGTSTTDTVPVFISNDCAISRAVVERYLDRTAAVNADHPRSAR